ESKLLQVEKLLDKERLSKQRLQKKYELLQSYTADRCHAIIKESTCLLCLTPHHLPLRMPCGHCFCLPCVLDMTARFSYEWIGLNSTKFADWSIRPSSRKSNSCPHCKLGT